MSRRPTLGIVVPIYKHSELAMEALASALDEARDADGVVVIVNDGCPFPQTHTLSMSFAEAWPEHVCYLRTHNGGLPAARNRGIRHAFARYPSIETIYLLDADNRLHRGAMRRALRTMTERAADWVYPPIDMFGLEAVHDFTQPYVVLRHLFENFCEAGSLVHRRVFDAGLAFDETMKLGWEDWQFWLRCAMAGFRGVPCPDFGLQYRARRESMLRDSDRDAEEIRVHMRRTLKPLFAWRNLLRLEQLEAPRFCCIDPAMQRFQFTSIPGERSDGGALDELAVRFWRHDIYPAHFHFPAFVVLASVQAVAQLRAVGLLDWVFWQIQDALGTRDCVTVALTRSPGRIDVALGEPDPAAAPHIVAVTYLALHRSARAADEAGVVALDDGVAALPALQLSVAAAFADLAGPRYGRADLAGLAAALRMSASRPESLTPWNWRPAALRSTRDLHSMVGQEMRAAGPMARGGARELAIVLPLLSFGGVEQVALQVAARFRAAGWTVRLVIAAANHCDGTALAAGVVDSIAFLNDPAQAGYNRGGPSYFGHNLQAWAKGGRHERLTALLAGCAAIVSFHAMHANETMGWLRRNGAVTVTSLHVLDQDPFGAPAGMPYMALPYEHAYDIVTTPSRQLAEFCVAAGIPEAKLLRLDNAPTFVASAEERQRRRAQLAADLATSTVRRLRVIYLGRLDRQKGVERLLAAIAATRYARPAIDWRVVGGAVVRDGEDWTARALSDLGIRPEPAIYARDALIERLLWADVVLLPSRWEGAPIILREAQSLGAIPVATRVGAVDELVAHQQTGWLIEDGDDAGVTEDIVGALHRLARDPELRARLSEGGMAATEGLTWARTAAPLVAEVERLVASRRRSNSYTNRH
jgi:glycosyltransferase involved in cell wall biosynthesis